jgi:hypothetical protein
VVAGKHDGPSARMTRLPTRHFRTLNEPPHGGDGQIRSSCRRIARPHRRIGGNGVLGPWHLHWPSRGSGYFGLGRQQPWLSHNGSSIRGGLGVGVRHTHNAKGPANRDCQEDGGALAKRLPTNCGCRWSRVGARMGGQALRRLRFVLGDFGRDRDPALCRLALSAAVRSRT